MFQIENPPENIAELRDKMRTFFQNLNRYEPCLYHNDEQWQRLKNKYMKLCVVSSTLSIHIRFKTDQNR